MGKDPFSCDYFATVNFGEGPVRVRCTEEGEHEYHSCEIKFMSVEPVETMRFNIFDEDGD